MDNPFIGTKYRTDCYKCKRSADQIIEAVPYQARVRCSNCGATRVFVPRIEDVAKPGSFSRIGPYPVWSLVDEAKCRNCHTTGPHDLSVGTRHLTVQCRRCGFTHLYRFDLEFMATDETKD
ncbi:MAG: hypothetical protein LUP97_02315 [Methanoregula sp.]|nr:hypothetical protein [Methanoregula sp.]